ncbi:MAG: hypothetical protein JO304_17170 [Solirubrobacterales bacterium]|nr:hypothetical protein [Solirubrobacterales bacterium]
MVGRRQSLDADLLACVPDPDAVRALYARHVDAVFRFAVRRCRDPEDVADLVSTVFLEMLSGAASYDRRRGEVRLWLLGIAACRRTRRASRPQSTISSSAIASTS